VTLIVYDPRIVADLRRIEADYLQESRPLSLNEWRARPIQERLAENMARLTAALQ
jgi:cardiolipin synthase